MMTQSQRRFDPVNEDLYFQYEWKYQKEDLKYCPRCAHEFVLEDLHIPDQPQLLCHNCQFVFYLDPKLAVVAVVLNKQRDKVLLLQRNEEPRKGLWNLPGGHVSRGDDLFETITNEVKEEAGLLVEVGDIIHTHSLPSEGLIQLTYEAIADSEEVKTNIESMTGRFFLCNEVPWDQLAFPSTKKILELYIDKE
jgi:ADP-ribose pyrophosphatase YjhB (NUDIX family)